MSVTNIRAAENEVNQGAVDELENALKLAKSGELVSFALCGSLVGHETLTTWATDDAPSLIGQLELLKLKLLNAMPVYSRD